MFKLNLGFVVVEFFLSCLPSTLGESFVMICCACNLPPQDGLCSTQTAKWMGYKCVVVVVVVVVVSCL